MGGHLKELINQIYNFNILDVVIENYKIAQRREFIIDLFRESPSKKQVFRLICSEGRGHGGITWQSC